MPDPQWHVGQRAVINRRDIVTVERVTPSGRVTADGRVFNPDGYERGCSGDPWNPPSLLELLTPEIEAQIARIQRGRAASSAAWKAMKTADVWVRQAFSSFSHIRRVPEVADVDKAERLAAAIRGVLEGAT